MNKQSEDRMFDSWLLHPSVTLDSDLICHSSGFFICRIKALIPPHRVIMRIEYMWEIPHIRPGNRCLMTWGSRLRLSARKKCCEYRCSHLTKVLSSSLGMGRHSLFRFLGLLQISSRIRNHKVQITFDVLLLEGPHHANVTAIVIVSFHHHPPFFFFFQAKFFMLLCNLFLRTTLNGYTII